MPKPPTTPPVASVRPGADHLAEMLRAQLALQTDSFGHDPLGPLNEEERVEFIRWNVLALTDELHEMLGEVGWKPWASSRHVNADLALNELVDAWHFFMNLLLAVAGSDGMHHTPESIADDFTERYALKRGINARRQASGYDGVTGKCPDCHRDLATVELYKIMDLDGSTRRACPCGKIIT